MRTVDETVIRVQSAEILEISVKGFPQGIHIHVILEKRVKPAHGNERLLRPFGLLELRRIASSKKGEGEYGGQDQGLLFARISHAWLLEYGRNYPIKSEGLWPLS
jgi:hypothetical protein